MILHSVCSGIAFRYSGMAIPFFRKLQTAVTDARRFSDIADNIFRFAPIDLNNEQFKSIHGDNECIKVENIEECVRFYKDYIIALNKEV